MTITNLTDKELLQAQRIAELEAEVERLKAAAKYAEHIDATPENQRETMLHDALTERNALRAQIEALQRDADRLDWLNKGDGVFKVVNTWYYKQEYHLPARKFKDVRNAIDAAIAALQPQNDELHRRIQG